MRASYRRAVPIVGVVLLCISLVGTSGAAVSRERLPTQDRVPVEGASVPDWNNLPYLRASNGWFRVLSNHETFGGVEISSNTPLTPNNPDPTPEEYAGINLEALWKTRCRAVDEQTARFSRKVYLPGHPATLQVSQWAYGSSSTGKHPLKSITVKVNGSIVHQTIGSAIQTASNRTVIELPNSAREAFRYGENTISLVAVKRATKKRAGYCSTKTFGAAFELAGTFQADVSSNIPHGQATGGAAFLPMTITNNGPSHLPAGTYPCDSGDCGYPSMSFWGVSDSATITAIIGLDGDTVQSPPREDCRSYPYSAGPREGFMLNCGLPSLAPGESLTIGIGMTYEDFTETSVIYFGYGAAGYAETVETNANNGEQDREGTWSGT